LLQHNDDNNGMANVFVLGSDSAIAAELIKRRRRRVPNFICLQCSSAHSSMRLTVLTSVLNLVLN